MAETIVDHIPNAASRRESNEELENERASWLAGLGL
jgi:hypothetical protein